MRTFGFLRSERNYSGNQNKENPKYRLDPTATKSGTGAGVEQEIQRWLHEEGFKTRRRALRSLSFRYSVHHNKLPSFAVFQPVGKTGQIYIESGIMFRSTEDGRVLDAFDSTHGVSWQLRQHLASRGFFFRFLRPNASANKPGAIAFSKPIHYDNLTKAKLLDTVFETVNATVFVLLTLQQYSASNRSRNLPYLS